MIDVLRFSCAGCDAVWRVLPHFLARHLWRVWTTVGVIVGTERARPVVVPSRTRRRWRARLETTGRRLVAILAGASEQLAGLVTALAPDPSRRDVVDALGGDLAEIAGLIERLAAGVRVM